MPRLPPLPHGRVSRARAPRASRTHDAEARLQVRGDAWRQMTLRTALMFPGAASAVFFALDILIWGQESSGAVPFSTMLALCFLWFCVSVPLVYTGSYFGFKRAPDEDPVRTNKIPRQVRPCSRARACA